VSKYIVRMTPHFQRIVDMPRVDWREVGAQYVEPLTQYLKTPGGTMTLHPWQAAALYYAHELGGAFIPAGVGQGKTLVSLLLPVLLEAKRPLLLVPASTRDKTLESDIPNLRRHFRMHPRLHILSYEEISTVQGARLLWEIQPDLIVADEAHCIARSGAARTRRFKRFLKEFSDTRFVAMSGTMTKTSIDDYRALAAAALPPEYHPIPPFPESRLWAGVLDDRPQLMVHPGAFKEVCGPRETPREWFQKRLASTTGVVQTTASSFAGGLYLQERTVKVPKKVQDALFHLEKNWCTPGGEECMTPLDVMRHGRELSCGFYYRWVWPKDAAGQPKVNKTWMEARAAWHKFVRETIRYSRSLDSPRQVVEAIATGSITRTESTSYYKWLDVCDEYDPVTEAVWLDDFLVLDVLSAADDMQRTGGIVWVEHTEFGERLQKLGLPYFGQGRTQAEILREGKVVALSQHAHKTGKNLQQWHQNLVVSCPSSGASWEQMLGRTHRQGQTADDVTCKVYLHTNALQRSMERAYSASNYIQQTTGQEQKLLLATCL